MFLMHFVFSGNDGKGENIGCQTTPPKWIKSNQQGLVESKLLNLPMRCSNIGKTENS